MLTFKASCLTFGPHPFVLTKLNSSFEFYSLDGSLVEQLNIQGQLLANFTTSYTKDAPVSATAILGDEGLIFMLFDGQKPKVVDTLIKLKDEETCTLAVTAKIVVAATHQAILSLDLQTYKPKVFKIDEHLFVPESLTTSGTIAACLLDNGGFVVLPSFKWFDNPKSFSKPAGLYLAHNDEKVFVLLRSYFNSTKRFLVQNIKTFESTLENVKVCAEKVVDLGKYIAWQQGNACQFFIKKSNKTFYIQSLNSDNYVLEPVLFQNHAAVCEISVLSNYELGLTVHDSYSVYLKAELNLFGDKSAEKIITKKSFTASHYYTDIAVYSTNYAILVKIADKHFYIVQEQNVVRLDGDFIPFISDNNFALYNRKTDEILLNPVRTNPTV